MIVEIELCYTIEPVDADEANAKSAIGRFVGLCEVRNTGVLMEAVIKRAVGREGRFYENLPDCVKIVVQSLRADFVTKVPYKAKCTRTMYSTEGERVRQRIQVEASVVRVSIPRIG